jgi:ligand-binding SRPBCC domain-containing protein
MEGRYHEQKTSLGGNTVTLHTLERTQTLPTDLQTAWAFFSDPRNLPKITPPSLGFSVLSTLPELMHAGMIARYTVKPFPLTKVSWITEITHMVEPHFFVDEQRFGPYRFWHHQHHFREVPGGIQMRDLVNYILPCGAAGNLAAPYVKKQLREIFDFRYDVLEKMSWSTTV